MDISRNENLSYNTTFIDNRLTAKYLNNDFRLSDNNIFCWL